MKMDQSIHGDVGKSNHGRVRQKGTRGQTFQTDYGRDNSSHVGSASKERGGKCAGGPTDISHSIDNGKVPTT